ncbi:MAG: ATP-binding protein [Elusimicrobia bacterium]|jgi:MinD superfamily P-loop ATPase|nr:ATP-binding protein [Elusimicrobiota bacterium]
MKEVLVISGKGGTGKTSITAALAVLQKRIAVADCDVDAPDLHILLKPRRKSEEEFIGMKEAFIDHSKCTNCGICYEVCEFDAISKDIKKIPFRCEGCGVCSWNCPAGAIKMKDTVTAKTYIADINNGIMVHADLYPGAEHSGKLASRVKEILRQKAQAENFNKKLIDGPPGIGCPVISSLSGVGLAVIITEPTVSGIHDMERILKLCRHFNVEPEVVINKFDLNKEKSSEIERYLDKEGYSLIEKIPFSRKFVDALKKCKTIVEFEPEGILTQKIKNINSKIWSKNE